MAYTNTTPKLQNPQVTYTHHGVITKTNTKT